MSWRFLVVPPGRQRNKSADCLLPGARVVGVLQEAHDALAQVAIHLEPLLTDETTGWNQQ